MPKTVRVKNIQGGTAPYQKTIIPIGTQSADSFNNVPNGTFRAKVTDANGNTTSPKVVRVDDPAHNTIRNINWNLIPTFALPTGLKAIAGEGFPRWADEASPTDALLRGWTHTENTNMDGAALVNAKRGSTLYFPFNTAYPAAVEEVVGSRPNARYVRVLEKYRVTNSSNAAHNFTYIDGDLVSQTVSIAAADVEPTVQDFWVLLNDNPTFSGALYLERLWSMMFVNPALASDDDIVEVGKHFYAMEKWSEDGANNNPTAFRDGFFLFDEEVMTNSARVNALLMKGMKLQAVADGNPLFILYYGKFTSNWGLGFYSGNETGTWKQKKFPKMAQANRDAGSVPNEWINQQALLDADCVYVEGGYYFKVPYGKERKYEKQGNSYVIDVDGERKWRTTVYDETVRGMTLPIRQWSDTNLYIDADPSYGYPDNRVGEVWWMVYQFYAMATRMIYACLSVAKKCRNDADIYTEFSNISLKVFGTYRDETEQNFPGYADHPRPISTYQTDFQLFQNFIMCETFYLWTEYGAVFDPASTNTSPYKARNKGTGYKCRRSPNNTENLQFSQFEDTTWALGYLTWIHTEHNIFGAGNKKIVAYQPADDTHEIYIGGRINGNKLWVVAAEPRLDPGDSILLTIKNKKNSFSRTVKIQFTTENEIFADVIVLPSGVTYEPSDIVFQYADLYGAVHTVSGDLRQHTVNPTVLPTAPLPSQTSLFEFFPKMNANPYPGASPLDVPTGNGYVTFKFSGWSIVSSDPALTPNTIQSHVKIQLFDSADVLVCNIIDRRGNYHPNFAPFFPPGTDLRSNNHLSEFAKYLPTGDYRLEITNLSPTALKQRIRLGTEGEGGDPLSIMDEDLLQGVTKVKNFTLSTPGNPYQKYVMNCNVYVYP